MKECITCKVLKNFKDFYKCALRKDGLQPHCKSCSVTKVRKYKAANRDRERKYSRSKHLKTKYGITTEQFEVQHTVQKGKCPLCLGVAYGVGGAKGVIDHCHVTGKIRGILCHPCNAALHAMERDRDWAKRANDYLDSGGIWEEQNGR